MTPEEYDFVRRLYVLGFVVLIAICACRLIAKAFTGP